MPRFFFHIRDGSSLIEDKKGADLPDLHAAHQEAVRAARCMIADLSEIGDTKDGQSFEICDAHGMTVDVVAFKEAYRQ
jgi:hypothetical protein